MRESYGAHSGKGALAAVLAALFLAVLIPIGAIFAKDYLGNEPPVKSEPLEEPAAPSSRSSTAAVRKEPASPSSASSAQEEPEPEKPPRFGLVEEGEAVSPSYFDDAVFFGDSLTDGLGAYSTLANATFIASTGVNPDSVFTKEAITLPGEEERCTMFSALGRSHPGKIYIMLGANWVGLNTGIEKKTFLHHYQAMLEKICEQQPEATIYIQSMLPVSREYEDNTNGNNHVGLTNAIIEEYNEALRALAEQMQLYYLDVHSAMADSAGYLPSEETSDGMHLTPDYYARWYDYLLTHTAPGEGPGEQAPEPASAGDASAAPDEAGKAPDSSGSSPQTDPEAEEPEERPKEGLEEDPEAAREDFTAAAR